MLPLGNILLPQKVQRLPIKGIDDKRQITAIFTVSMTGKFLPIQLIYEGKTPRCLLDLTFQLILMSPFLITIGPIREKSIELFKNVIFSYLKQAKASLTYPKEQCL